MASASTKSSTSALGVPSARVSAIDDHGWPPSSR
jgi:hypothetical protein